ncbi:MAG: SRPBCC family protein [Acidimicrobiia bacterium]|nr:SRPBCC family protein [Acidimicrobiia bacterium]
MAVRKSSDTARVRKLGRSDYRIVAHIDIDAPGNEVWSVLTDWEHLADWNSSFLALTGDFVEGGQVRTTFRMLGVKRHYEHELMDFIEGRQFGWSDPFLFGMTDHHIFRVEPIDSDRTRFHQTDRVYAGASSVFGALTARLVMRMHARFNRALAAEVARRRAEH